MKLSATIGGKTGKRLKMIEFKDRHPDAMTLDEAVMIAFMTPGWRLPTREEYIAYDKELTYCFDQGDIHDLPPNVRTGYLRLVRDVK